MQHDSILHVCDRTHASWHDSYLIWHYARHMNGCVTWLIIHVTWPNVHVTWRTIHVTWLIVHVTWLISHKTWLMPHRWLCDATHSTFDMTHCTCDMTHAHIDGRTRRLPEGRPNGQISGAFRHKTRSDFSKVILSDFLQVDWVARWRFEKFYQAGWSTCPFLPTNPTMKVTILKSECTAKSTV